MAVCQNLVPLVNIKIAGKWMFIPLKMVSIGIDPYPYTINHNFKGKDPPKCSKPSHGHGSAVGRAACVLGRFFLGRWWWCCRCDTKRLGWIACKKKTRNQRYWNSGMWNDRTFAQLRCEIIWGIVFGGMKGSGWDGCLVRFTKFSSPVKDFEALLVILQGIEMDAKPMITYTATKSQGTSWCHAVSFNHCLLGCTPQSVMGQHMRVQFYLRKTITQMSKYTKTTYNKPNEFRKQKRKVYAAIWLWIHIKKSIYKYKKH